MVDERPKQEKDVHDVITELGVLSYDYSWM